VNETVGAGVPDFVLLILRSRLFIQKSSEGRQRTRVITSRLYKFEVRLEADMKLVMCEKG